jgi:uncharacterized phage-like protein YoqJ
MIIAATGHRPSKLGGYSDHTWRRLLLTAERALELLEPREVISGMALGWDQAIATQALAMGIPVVAAVPFAGQEDRWPYNSQQRFRDLLDRAREAVVVSLGGYSPARMQRRNEWMVDRCDTVLALWDGSPGGTSRCVEYAQRIGRPVRNVWSLFQSMN